jgi:hypothetical protein
MSKINQKQHFILRMALAIMIAIPAALLSPAPAEGAGVSLVIPLARLFSAGKARNRVYRTANAYIDEKRDYYDRLREKAREQLASREIGGLRKSQVAAYVKLVALIEGERGAMIDFSESEKRAAREKFINTFEDVAFNRILASGIAARALGALSNGVNSSQSLIDQALDELTGGGSGALQKVQRIRRIAARVTVAGGLIGGSVGEKIRAIGGTIVQAIDRPTAEIEAGLEKVKGDLADLQSEIADLQQRGVQPTASQVTRDVAITVVTGEEGDPAVDAIISILAGKTVREGGTFRDRARSALIGTFVARCAAIGERYREAISRLEGEAAGEAMSDEQAFAPCNAIDLEEIAQEVEATDQVARLTATPQMESNPPQVSLEDLCTLLPIDSSLVEQNTESSCVAIIDSLLGCAGCLDRMSITKVASLEAAQEAATGGKCGNPNFSARIEHPLGDAGFACRNTSDEEFRAGVAQSYYHLSFSRGRYVVSISTGYPGREELVLELGQEIIDRIDQLPPDAPPE